MVMPKYMSESEFLKPMMVTLLGKGSFADIMKDLEMMQSPWIGWVDPKSNGK